MGSRLYSHWWLKVGQSGLSLKTGPRELLCDINVEICVRGRPGPPPCRGGQGHTPALQYLSRGRGQKGCHGAPCPWPSAQGHMWKPSGLSKARDPSGVRSHLKGGAVVGLAGHGCRQRPSGQHALGTLHSEVQVCCATHLPSGDPRPGGAEGAEPGFEARLLEEGHSTQRGPLAALPTPSLGRVTGHREQRCSSKKSSDVFD